MIRRVVVGMSGGVDSAVSAHLLKERGLNVLGVFMRNWDEHDEIGRCTGEQDLKDAEWACRQLQIELRQVNYVKQYWTAVFSQFLDDYQQGLTPNPDILCNKHIKFDLFHRHALDTLQYDAVATGHYARNSLGDYLEHRSTDQQKADVRLLIPADTFKDQTFFLAGIPQTALQFTMFPLGGLLKTEVKQLARRIGLQRLAVKRESTGICFVGKRDFKAFIREYISCKPGHFVDVDSGEVVGNHEGIHQWTVGQRCRLSSYLQPYFVARKDAASNTIFVAAGHDHPALHSIRIRIGDFNWLCNRARQQLATSGSLRCRFRFQHTKPVVECWLRPFEVLLDAPLRAITPGQYAVFYDDVACLGSARILCAEPLQQMEQQAALES
ncbi:mitochondrial tRNA-specific 2-thiouridylase 1 [Drosophila grimshawi]|uniref:tRNA-5-taurinomethyluridine 2-sulfurtransferase n=1 Tax=Drosophila grimshawi TaxID=7222 RepID=B4JKU9_DROGR|nr:mitochondrial tRNA-specific 2-thiouridylase 1 [Drosophila grimshawi]EDW00202.1 GH11989 [Drosophila grimshawi]